MSDWTSSTLIFVRDVDASIHAYVDLLGFTLNMRFEDEGVALVAGVSRGDGCALLLTSQWPDKVGTAVIYTALPQDELVAFRAMAERGGFDIGNGFWGKEIMILTDPDGNQLWFPLS